MRKVFVLGWGCGVLCALLCGQYVVHANQFGGFGSDNGAPNLLDQENLHTIDEANLTMQNSTQASRRSPVVQAVEQVVPTVVAISTEIPAYNPFGWGGASTNSSQGSGVVIDSKGIVLTNAHVVEDAVSIEATFTDQHTYKAEIIGIAPELDLAVLKLEKTSKDTKFTAVSIGSSETVLLGETVIALGNPFGLGHTVTTGVISAINRPLETEKRIYQDFLQTDASINPGNSGGPLVNINGELIGINTAIRSDAEGIGFAIPVDRAMKVAQDLVNFGKVQQPWLGVDIQDVPIQREGKRVYAPQVSWVYLDKNGLAKGDVILSIDNKQVRGRGDLNAYLATLQPNSKVTMEIWKNASIEKITMTVQLLPESVVDVALNDILGVTLSAKQGMITVAQMKAGGAFARNQLHVGDQVVAINGQKIQSIEDVRTIINNSKNAHKGSAVFTIRRGRAQAQIELPI